MRRPAVSQDFSSVTSLWCLQGVSGATAFSARLDCQRMASRRRIVTGTRVAVEASHRGGDGGGTGVTPGHDRPDLGRVGLLVACTECRVLLCLLVHASPEDTRTEQKLLLP